MRRHGWFAFVILAVYAAVGCNSRDAENLKSDTQHIAADAGQAFGSATLAGKVNAVLTLRKGVDMSGLHVEAQDDVVTVSGHVHDRAERKRVIDTINGIRGVDRVVNHVEIQSGK